MSTRHASTGRSLRVRDRNSVPVLVVRLGPARDFLIALVVLGVTLLIAMAIAFLAYG
jgi:hypothetical protein